MTMKKPQTYCLIFLGLFSFAFGFESGKEYMYKYVVRSMSGVNVQNGPDAVIEMQNRVIVQCVDDYTIIIRFLDSHIKRNGKYQGDVYNNAKEFDGDEEHISDYEYELLGAPFSVSHDKGSIIGMKIGADEHQWIVNLKKSFARQFLLNSTGSRRDDSTRSYNKFYNGDNEPDSFIIFEDFKNGRCRTKIDITKLPVSQEYLSKTNNLEVFETTCRDNQIYGIIKTTDFNQCETNRFWDSSTSSDYSSDFDNNDSKRNLELKYVACGKSLSELTVVQGETSSSLIAQPPHYERDRMNRENELVNFAITNMELKQVKEISYAFRVGSYMKEHKSLASDLNFFELWKQYGSRNQPNDFDSFNQRKRNRHSQSFDFDSYNQWKRNDRHQPHDFDSYNQWKRNGRDQHDDFDSYNQWKRNRRDQHDDFDSHNQSKRSRDQPNDFNPHHQRKRDFDSYNQWKRNGRDQAYDSDFHNQWKRNHDQPDDFDSQNQRKRSCPRNNQFDSPHQ